MRVSQEKYQVVTVGIARSLSVLDNIAFEVLMIYCESTNIMKVH